MMFFNLSLKSLYIEIADVLKRRKVFAIILLIVSLIGAVGGITIKKTGVYFKGVDYEYFLKYSLVCVNEKIGKVLLSGALTILCNFIFVLLFSFCKYLSPIAVFICFVKSFALTQTFIVFYELLGLINFLALAILLLPFEILFNAIYVFSFIVAGDVSKTCETNRVKIALLRTGVLFLISLTIYVLSIFIVRILFIVLYSKTL